MKERTLEGREQNKDEAQEILDSWQELQLATRVKIEMALGLRDKPSEEQVNKFKRNLWRICI